MRKIFGRPTLHIIIIAFLGLIVYSNTFDVPFIFDDWILVVQNPLIKDIEYFLDLNKAEHKAEEMRLTEVTRRHFRTRVVGNLSLWANYRVHGLDVWGYHSANLALHIINAVLVYLLVALTLRTPLLKSSSLSVRSNSVALFVGLLFVSHPLQTEAVTYIVARFVLLVAMFYLLTLVLYIKARELRSAEGQNGRKSFNSLVLYCTSVLTCVLAMKTKENAFTLPVAIALYEFMFFPGPHRMRRALFLVPFILTMLIIPLQFLDMNMGGGIGRTLEEATRLELSLPRADYLFTQFRVVVSYMGLLLFPITQSFSHDPVVYHSFFTPPVFLSFVFLCFVLCVGIYLYCRSRNTGQALRLSAFGIFFFFLALSVESSVLPIGEIMVEYRVYLPSVGLLTSVVVLVFSGSPRKNVVFPALLAIVLGLSAVAYERNAVWKTNISLWEDVVRKSYGKARGHFNLGVAYKSMGRFEEAIEQFRLTIERYPTYRDTYNELGITYGMNGELEKAILVLEKTIDHWPDYVFAHYNLGRAYHESGKIELAEQQYRKTLELFPAYAEAYGGLGSIYIKRGMFDQAMVCYENALQIDEWNPLYYLKLGDSYREKGMADKAIEHYRTALELAPDNAQAHYNLGLIYLDQGLKDEARGEFEEALRIDPDHVKVRESLDRLDGNSRYRPKAGRS
jgi:tetratricopeptide (TPR) repeat protein